MNNEKISTTLKSIVCFGDSNTWGAIPAVFSRFPRDVRWPGLLQKTLGSSYLVNEEGLCGRTTAYDDPNEADRNGFTHLQVILETHAPIDLLIIMLGTNDFKHHLNLSPETIAAGAEKLVRHAKHFQPRISKILLVSPALIVEADDTLETTYFEGGVEKSKRLAPLYAEVASRHGCDFFDAAQVISSHSSDGIHLDAEAHRRLAESMAVTVRIILE